MKAVAGQYCCEPVVERLLAAGADPNIALEVFGQKPKKPRATILAGNLYSELRVTKKVEGTTALGFAIKKKRGKIAEMLAEAGAQVTDEHLAAASKKLRAALGKRA